MTTTTLNNIWVHTGNHGFYTDFGTKNIIEIGEFYHTDKQNYIERGNTGVKSVYDFTEGTRKGEYRKNIVIGEITINQDSQFEPCLVERHYFWEGEEISQDKYYDLIIKQYEVWKKECLGFALNKVKEIEELHQKGVKIHEMKWSTLGSNHVSYTIYYPHHSTVELHFSNREALYKGDVRVVANMW